MEKMIQIKFQSTNGTAKEVYTVVMKSLNEAMTAVAADPVRARELKLELMDMVARLENAEAREVRS